MHMVMIKNDLFINIIHTVDASISLELFWVVDKDMDRCIQLAYCKKFSMCQRISLSNIITGIAIAINTGKVCELRVIILMSNDFIMES